jgi:hypothetical protein
MNHSGPFRAIGPSVSVPKQAQVKYLIVVIVLSFMTVTNLAWAAPEKAQHLKPVAGAFGMVLTDEQYAAYKKSAMAGEAGAASRIALHLSIRGKHAQAMVWHRIGAENGNAHAM